MSAQSSSAATAVSQGNARDPAALSILVGLAGLVVGAVGFIYGLQTGQSRLVTSWLLGLTFWLSIGVGMLFMIMIWYIFDAGWPIVIRRQLEHGLAAMKWLGLLFVPLLLVPLFSDSPGIVWKWMDANYVMPGGFTVAEDSLYQAKASYLNVAFFLARAVLFFAVFIGLAEYLRRASFSMDLDGDPRWARRARVTSAFGLIVLAMVATFAAFDWFMSLEFHWFSTIFGVWFFSASMRAGIAAATILCILMMWQGRLGGGLFNRAHCYFLGSMALAFTVFWAYISFSQYFLIYNANIPEETFWYTMRIYTVDGEISGWGWILLTLVFLHFLFPFLLLLWYPTKVIVKRLLFISAWILVFHLLDLYFNIVPRKRTVLVTEENPFGYTVYPIFVNGLDLLVDLAVIIGIGGVCAWAFFRSMKQTAIIPIRDPRIREAVNCHE